VPGKRQQIRLLARRELATVARTPGYAVLAVALASIALAVVWAGGVAGYVPAALDLLTPIELLVSAAAVVLGHRVFVTDRRSGEASVRETFPVSARTVVLGVFLGRGVALAAGVALALAPPAALVAASGGGATLAVSHGGVDSVLLYLRFLALTTLFGLSILAVSLAASAVAGKVRSGVALAAGLWLALAVGADLALVAGVGRGILGSDALVTLLAASPTGAYRGLVLETVVGAATPATLGAAAAGPSLLGLVAWTGCALWVAARGLR
jgi:ABC-2 type transport system permease protein